MNRALFFQKYLAPSAAVQVMLTKTPPKMAVRRFNDVTRFPPKILPPEADLTEEDLGIYEDTTECYDLTDSDEYEEGEEEEEGERDSLSTGMSRSTLAMSDCNLTPRQLVRGQGVNIEVSICRKSRPKADDILSFSARRSGRVDIRLQGSSRPTNADIPPIRCPSSAASSPR